MELIFMGGFFPQQYLNTIISKSKLQVQNSANTFQWAFIKGLEQNLKTSLKLITAPFIGWYPKYFSDPILNSTFFPADNILNECTMVGFPNLPIVKNFFKSRNLFLTLNRIVSKEKETVVIVYSLDTPYLQAAIKAKIENPNLKVCLIVPDLHEFPGDAGLFYKWYIKYYEKPKFYGLLDQIDCFVLLTDQMAEYLKINNKPWVRVEGLYLLEDNPVYNAFNKKQDSKKIILYTGTLDFRYGLKQLMDAFALIKSNDYELQICGGGSGLDLVNKRAMKDKRIKYYGILPREKVLELQRQATILINPRNSVGDYNKYSFPSKTIEYFVSGTPVLMYKLEGVPLEYYQHCFTITDNTVEALSESIYATCQLSNDIRHNKGEEAKQFILLNKNAEKQCKKVLDMLINSSFAG